MTLSQPDVGVRCKCERCGFNGFIAPLIQHVCTVMVNLDELEKSRKDAERYRMLRFLLCEDDNDRWPALGTTELQLDDEVDQEIRDAKGKGSAV